MPMGPEFSHNPEDISPEPRAEFFSEPTELTHEAEGASQGPDKLKETTLETDNNTKEGPSLFDKKEQPAGPDDNEKPPSF